MNYRDNFWQGVSKIEENFIDKRESFSKLYYAFSRLVTLQTEFSEGMEDLRIYFDLEKEESTIDKALKQFSLILGEEASMYKKIADFTKENIILLMERILNENYKEGQNLKGTNHEVDGNFRELLDDLERKKEDFHSDAQKAKQKHLDFIVVEKSLQSESKKKAKMQEQAEEAIKDAEIKKTIYEKAIFTDEEKRKKYIEEKNDIFNKYEEMDRDLSEKIKETLESYFILRKGDSSNMLNFISSSIKIFEQINTDNDINKFVEQNKTIGFQPKPLEFIPYSDETLIFSDNVKQKYHLQINKKELNEEIKIFLNTHFQPICWSKDEIKEVDEMKKTVEKAWEGTLTEEEMKALISKFEVKPSLESIFLSILNKKRPDGKFSVNSEGYQRICFIMNKILDLNMDVNSRNYQYCGFCIILSQTYFKEEENEKIYLQNSISEHPLLHQPDFWIGLSKFYIDSDVQGKNTHLGYDFELTEEKVSTIISVALMKVMTCVHNMCSFKVKKEVLDEVINKLCNTYNIDIAIIENVIKNYNSKSKDSIPGKNP